LVQAAQKSFVTEEAKEQYQFYLAYGARDASLCVRVRTAA
jgi:hypothetical protein